MGAPYPSYRASGLPWTPMLPEGWQVMRNGRLFGHRVETGYPDLPILEVSLRTGVRVRDMDNLKRKQVMSQKEKYKRAAKGDIAYNMMRMWQGAVGPAPVDGLVSPAYVVVKPYLEANSAYFSYLFRTSAYMREVNKFSRGIVADRNRLYWESFKQMPSPVPPRSEQDLMVAYLRAQDAHIARFIKAERDLIGLLTEQRQTIIDDAITQGVDAAVTKRASGIDWIDRIPSHWETCKLKHIAIFNPSRSESAARHLSNEMVSFLPMENITTDGKLQNVESRKISEVWEGYTYFRRNDVVVAKITPCFENGKGGLLDALPTEIGFGTTEFIVLRPVARRVRPAFLAKLLSLKTFRILGADAMTGAAGQQRVPLEFVKNFRVALPSLDEQDEILRALETATEHEESAIERIKNEIVLICEYRDRLIADVVTGQVDVRGWTPSTGDAVSDDDWVAIDDDESETTGVDTPMPTTDTSEKGLEALIVRDLVTGGYAQGQSSDYNRDVALDVPQLLAFLKSTQPNVVAALNLGGEGIRRTQFLHRLQGEIAKRGVVDVLRKGVNDGPAHLDLYKLLPTLGNAAAAEAFGKNVFSVTRQVRYSSDEAQRALDMVIFINGLPMLTFELKNSLTKQTVADAVVQYQTDRNPTELLFQLGRCIAHMAVDDVEVRFCTHLTGKTSWFLPFNQGWDSGAGNPPNPYGLKTDYLWKQVLTKESLANIVENFAQVIEEEEDGANGKKRKTRKQVFPRFHQLRSVRALLRRSREDSVGKRYLIQHSAGSGKSNTIAWLAHQLAELKTVADASHAQFDSVIVITDRRALDTAIARTIKAYDHVASIFGHSDSAQELRTFLRRGKKIIVTTVQQFPFILDEVGDLRDKKFALLIDEAHSSQGGKITAKMHLALSGGASSSEDEEEEEEETVEDTINKLITSRKMLGNASYYAFTATPKTKTLELFGERYVEGDTVRFRSPEELTYTTKQAIQEGFILDVIANYTPVDSFYHVAKTVEDDPDFDKVKALKKIRHYVESHDKAIRRKAEIMVDHFTAQVIVSNKIGGKARAMIVCNGIARAIDYFREVSHYLTEIKSAYKAIVAYSGEFEISGVKKSEADLNGFPSKDIPTKLKQDPYRFLIVANKFVTGFDEPLLHTMYVDKPLAGVQAVQTLSRLNRAHPKKADTFVLDFANNAEAVKEAFQDYYRATVQVGETDPNKLHDLKNELDAQQVYSLQQVDDLVALYLGGADRDKLDPILDACVAEYAEKLGEDDQVKFKGKAKAFVRSYGFLSAILPYGHPAWEKLSIFLNFLIPKLPAPKEEDLSRGVLEAIDMDSYRAQAQASLKMAMDDTDAFVEPPPPSGGGGGGEPELDKLSNIIRQFNDLFGNIEWHDADKIRKVIIEEIPARVAQDKAYQNAQANSGRQNARLEHDKALNRVVLELLDDHTELFKQFSDNSSFKRWLADMVFDTTYQPGSPPPSPPQAGASA